MWGRYLVPARWRQKFKFSSCFCCQSEWAPAHWGEQFQLLTWSHLTLVRMELLLLGSSKSPDSPLGLFWSQEKERGLTAARWGWPSRLFTWCSLTLWEWGGTQYQLMYVKVHADGRAARAPYYSLVNIKSRLLFWPLLMEKEVATHSSTLAWKIPWTEGPGRPLIGPWGRKKSDTTEQLHCVSTGGAAVFSVVHSWYGVVIVWKFSVLLGCPSLGSFAKESCCLGGEFCAFVCF